MKIQLFDFPTPGKMAVIEGSLYECSQVLHWLGRDGTAAPAPTAPAPDPPPRRGRKPGRRPSTEQKQKSESKADPPDPAPEPPPEESAPTAPEAHAAQITHFQPSRPAADFRWKEGR